MRAIIMVALHDVTTLELEFVERCTRLNTLIRQVEDAPSDQIRADLLFKAGDLEYELTGDVVIVPKIAQAYQVSTLVEQLEEARTQTLIANKRSREATCQNEPK